MIARAVLKAATWRIAGTGISLVTVGLLTGLWRFALVVGAIETGIKVVFYVIHELAWEWRRGPR